MTTATTDITTITPNPEPMPLMQMAEVFAASKFFPSAADAARAAVKIMAGRELGVGAVCAMQNIHCFDGKIALGVHLVAAKIKASGKYDYRVKKSDVEECVIEFYEGDELLGESPFTITEAKAAGLLGKDNWKKYPADMLYSRAMSRGARRYCPDVFMGAVYTPEDFGDSPVVTVTPPPPPPDIDLDAEPPATPTGDTIDAEHTDAESEPVL